MDENKLVCARNNAASTTLLPVLPISLRCAARQGRGGSTKRQPALVGGSDLILGYISMDWMVE
jgi:hypothetical protein